MVDIGDKVPLSSRLVVLTIYCLSVFNIVQPVGEIRARIKIA